MGWKPALVLLKVVLILQVQAIIMSSPTVNDIYYGGFKKELNKRCKPEGREGNYNTLELAIEACKNSNSCESVFHLGCSSLFGFSKCNGVENIAPGSSTYRSCIYRKPQVCTDGGQRCHFPFINNGKTYYTCTEPGGRQNRPWCAETVTEENEYYDWDYCCDWDNVNCGQTCRN